MKTIIISFLAISLFLQVLHAQVDESRTFVYLQNDSVRYADNLWLQDGEVFNKSTNTTFYSFNEIRFVNAENGFYANTRNVRTRNAPYIAKRTIKGEINLFESQTIFVEGSYAPGANQGALINKKKYYNYFNKGFENLTPVSYKALNPYFSNNSESLAYLDKYRNANITGRVLNIAEYGVYVGGFYLAYKSFRLKLRNDPSFSPVKSFILPLGVLITGYGVGLASNWFGAKKVEHLRESIVIYDGIK